MNRGFPALCTGFLQLISLHGPLIYKGTYSPTGKPRTRLRMFRFLGFRNPGPGSFKPLVNTWFENMFRN